MACTSITDIVVNETGRFDSEIYSRAYPRTPWIPLIVKKPFPEGMGYVISNLTYWRQAPTDATPNWTDVEITEEGTGGAIAGGLCVPTATAVAMGSVTRSWKLARQALQGPDFCAEELRTPFQVATQLSRIKDALVGYSTIEWEFRYRSEYLRLCGTKVVVGAAGLTEGTSTGWPAACPGAKLNFGILNKYRLKLLREGAADNPIARAGGMALLTVVGEPEVLDDMVRSDDDIRQDLRYAEPNMLLQAINHDRRVYRGFILVNDLFAKRYTCSETTATEVDPFEDNSKTKGTGSDVTAAYLAAPYVATFIFDSDVFHARIPKPVTNPGADLSFNAVNYTPGAGGDWKWLNIPDRTCNPRQQIGFHHGILAAGSEPVHPERGVAFLSLRCDPEIIYVTACT